jgi:hypothetical protein
MDATTATSIKIGAEAKSFTQPSLKELLELKFISIPAKWAASAKAAN